MVNPQDYKYGFHCQRGAKTRPVIESLTFISKEGNHFVKIRPLEETFEYTTDYSDSYLPMETRLANDFLALKTSKR